MDSKSEFLYDVFPKSFTWGMANSSYQTEGAWNVDGKGESIWDRFCHEDPSRIDDKSNGDEAMDSYHKYKEDVQLLKNMGAKMYRFSISWPRILPKGTLEHINQPGIDYYNKLIDELLANGIQPMVTLFHWDLPQALQDIGGFCNEELIGLFGEYSRVCFKSFGDRVKHWITFNEPYIFTMKAYDFAAFPPAIKEPVAAPYKVVHTMLKAHTMAYHIYDVEFRRRQKGKLGLAVDTSHYGPRDPESEEDKAAAERAYEFRVGWIADPLIFGDYPDSMKNTIDAKSKLEGRKDLRLPLISDDWSSKIRGSVDFLGLNYYTSELVRFTKPGEPSETNSPGWNEDLGTDRIRNPNGRLCGIYWQRDVPWGLRETLNWIKKRYGNPEIIITENGESEKTDHLDDDARVGYFKGHINETLKAIKLDKCNVTGYLGWCLLDVFEWASGYTVGFGVHQVNRDSKQKTRTPKNSALYLTKIFNDNGFIKEELTADTV